MHKPTMISQKIILLILALAMACGQAGVSASVLGHMLPLIAVNDAAYGLDVNVELAGQIFKRLPFASEISNLPDIIASQLGGGALFPGFHASLCKTIRNIILRRPEKQVIRPNATRVIAFVTGIHADRECSECQLPRYPMNLHSLLVSRDRPIVMNSFSSKPHPEPAAIGFLYAIPESLIERARCSVASLAGMTAKFSGLSTHTTIAGGEYALAI